MVLNYHRIGDKDETEYDPGLFSSTAEDLDWQIGHLKRRFRMTTLEEVLGLLAGRRPSHRTAGPDYLRRRIH
jgi:hypothetical protein